MAKFRARKGGRFVTLESVGLRLTKKEFEEAKGRFNKFEKLIDKRFKRLRSPKQKKILPKLDIIPATLMGLTIEHKKDIKKMKE